MCNQTSFGYVSQKKKKPSFGYTIKKKKNLIWIRHTKQGVSKLKINKIKSLGKTKLQIDNSREWQIDN